LGFCTALRETTPAISAKAAGDIDARKPRQASVTLPATPAPSADQPDLNPANRPAFGFSLCFRPSTATQSAKIATGECSTA